MRNPIQSLPVRDGLVLALPFFARTLRDYSGYGHHPVASGSVNWISIGGVNRIAFGTNGVLTVADTPELQSTVYSALVACDQLGRYSNTDRLISKRDATGTNFDWRINSATQIGLYDGVATPFLIDNHSQRNRVYGLTVTSGYKARDYLDGVFIGEYSAASTITADDAPLLVGNYWSGAFPQPNPMGGVLLYTRELTAAEMAEASAWLDSQTSPSVPHDRRYFNLGSLVPVGGEEVGAWDFGITNGRAVPDQSGNGATGTMFGEVAPAMTDTGRVLRGFGYGREAVQATIAGVDDITIELLAKPKGVGAIAGRFLQSAKLIMYVVGSPVNGIAVGLTGVTGIPATFPSILVQNEWSHIVFTRRRSDGLVKVYINGVQAYSGTCGTETIDYTGATTFFNSGAPGGVRAFDGDIKFARILNRYMEADEVQRRYQPIGEKILYSLNMDQVPPTLANVTAGTIPGTDYQAASGTWAVVEATDGKYIDPVGNGWISRPSSGAYGSWKFDFQTDSGGNQIIGFICTTQTLASAGAAGYALYWHSDGSLRLTKFLVGGVNAWLDTYNAFPTGVRHSYFVTRNFAGLFNVYCKGGTFVDWTLILSATDTTTTTSTNACMFGIAAKNDRLYTDTQYLGVTSPQ
jgi:hypothetical protein